jgi:hypothetical protein
MKLKSMFCSAIVASLSLFASASAAQDAASPKAAICYTFYIRDIAKTQPSFNCPGAGKFTNISEVYERGYRVVSSNVLAGSSYDIFIVFIEKRTES